MSEKMKARAVSLLAKAGVTINGTEPHSLLVRDERLYRRVFAHGSLGFCEAFMDGWWGARDLPAFFRKIFAVNLHRELWGIETALLVLQARILDMQSVRRSKRVARQHYDLTPVHEAMLGAYRVYSGGYWRGGAKTLDEAQSAQLERNCQMLALRPGETLLDMGCGWGEQLKWAWTHHGVRGVGLTLSHEQVAYACEQCADMPIEFHLTDYRHIAGSYDKIVSTGMFEHVGPKHSRTFMLKVRELLKDAESSRALIQSIAGIASRDAGNSWMNRYIFPGGVIQSAAQMFTAMDGLLVPIMLENIGPDYALTLRSWRENFKNAWPRLWGGPFDERFYRMWDLYLASSEASFDVRHHQLYRMLLSATGVPADFHPPAA